MGDKPILRQYLVIWRYSSHDPEYAYAPSHQTIVTATCELEAAVLVKQDNLARVYVVSATPTSEEN